MSLASLASASNYVVGIDLGVASIGFAAVEQLPFRKNKIHGMFVRTWGLTPSQRDGKASKDRAQKKRQRRTLRRHRERMSNLRSLMKTTLVAGVPLLDAEGEAAINAGESHQSSVWNLRDVGLSQSLCRSDWSRVIYHLCGHRGYKPAANTEFGKKTEAEMTASDKETKAISSAAHLNHSIAEQWGTVGRAFAQDERFKGKKRNSPGSYLCSIMRTDIESELRVLFAAQRSFGNCFASEVFEEQVLELLNHSAPPLTGEAIMEMVRDCPFEEGEKCAPVMSPSFERFRALSNIANLTAVIDGEGEEVTTDFLFDRQALRREVWSRLVESGEVSYFDVRCLLLQQDNPRFRFRALRNFYESKVGKEKKSKNQDRLLSPSKKRAKTVGVLSPSKIKSIESRSFVRMPGYAALKKALSVKDGWGALCGDFEQIDSSPNSYRMLDEVSNVLFAHKVPADVHQHLSALGLSELQIDALADLGMSGVGGMSLEALRNINVQMQKDDLPLYSDAVKRHFKTTGDVAYEKHHSIGRNVPPKRTRQIPYAAVEGIKNGVVRKSIWTAIKMVNSIIREAGGRLPKQIHIESVRDLVTDDGKAFDDEALDKAIENNKERAAAVEILKKAYKDRGLDTFADNEQLIRKIRLHALQQGQCIYSKEPISIDDLIFSSGCYEIDHALPESRSFDNGMRNLVLCTAQSNQDKGCLTPFEWLGGASDTQAWRDFVARVNATQFSSAKKKYICQSEIKEGFINRNLSDTTYATKLLGDILRDWLPWEDVNKQNVRLISASAVAKFRRFWGIDKNRKDNRHHANDALVVACITAPMVKDLVDEIRAHEITGARFSRSKVLPFNENERKEIYDQIFISRPLCRMVSGAIHDDTLNGATNQMKKDIANGMYSRKSGICHRVSLCDLTNKMFSDIKKRDNRGRLGFVIKQIEDRLSEYKGAEDKKWETVFSMKALDANPIKSGPGENATQVRALVVAKSKGHDMEVRRGNSVAFAKNGSIVRVDVFREIKTGKFLFVPVYLSDTGKPLPTRICSQSKTNDLYVTDTIKTGKSNGVVNRYVFERSVYKGEWLEIGFADRVVKGYFNTIHSSLGQLIIDFAVDATNAVTATNDNYSAPVNSGKLQSYEGCKIQLGCQNAISIKYFSIDIFGRKKLIDLAGAQRLPLPALGRA